MWEGINRSLLGLIRLELFIGPVQMRPLDFRVSHPITRPFSKWLTHTHTYHTY